MEEEPVLTPNLAVLTESILMKNLVQEFLEINMLQDEIAELKYLM